MSESTQVRIAVAGLLALLVWFAWPADRKPDRTEVRQARRSAEAAVLELMPEGYQDSLARFVGTDTVAIWPPGTDLRSETVSPIWIGTVEDLRSMLAARPKRSQQDLFSTPEGAAP